MLSGSYYRGNRMRRDSGRFANRRNVYGRAVRGRRLTFGVLAAIALVAAACAPEPEGQDPVINVTASSATVTYGDPIPEITATYSSPPAVAATCSTTATQSSPPGTYPTVCEGASDPDRIVTYHDGAITIVPAPVTVKASSASITVGDAIPAVNAEYSGLKLGATAPATLATCSTAATANSPAGTYATSCSGAADPNYTFTYVNGVLDIARAPVIVTASSGTHTYGDAAPAVTAHYAGFKRGETVPATPATCVSASNAHSPVGTYASSCQGAADANYTFSYVPGTVTVTPAPLTITASSAAMTAGQAAPVITPLYSGLVNGDSAPALPPTCGTTAGPGSPVGTYPSSCQGASDPNYAISYVAGTVTVNAGAAPVVVTASSATVTYGDAVPAITPSYSGLGGGTPATPATCTTTATSTSPVGTYPTVCSGAADPGHTFSYVNGSVTIVPAPVVVKASSGTMTYGSAVPAVTASYTGLRNGQTAPVTPAICSTSASANSPVGSYTSSCAGAADPNHTFSYSSGTVTVTKANVVVTAGNATFDQGAPVPAITASYNGFRFGESGPAVAPTCSTDATSSSAPGTYASTCSGASDPNYAFSYVDGTVTVTVPPLPVPTATGYAGYSTLTKATTIAAASDGKALPNGNIDVASTAGFEDYTNLTIVSSAGAQTVFCNSAKGSATRFQGCSGGTGTLSTGAFVTDAAPNSFDVYTIMGGAATLEPASLKVLNDVPAAFRGLPATVSANASVGLVTSVLTPAATGSFSLLFGICNKGTTTYSVSNPACHAGQIIYSAGAVSTMGAEVKVSALFLTITSNVYQKVHTAITAPQTVKQNDTVTVYAAAAGSAIPKANPSSAGDVPVNYVKDISIIFPIPAGMQFVSATTMGGDARTSGQLQFKYCPTAGTSGCIAKLTGDYDQTTVPYMQVSLPASLQVPGGATMTVPTVAFTMKAVGAPGTVAKATLTQFNLTTNVSPVTGATNARFEGYPTEGSNTDVKPPKKRPAVLGSILIAE